jgi:hypothetical protein
LITTPKIYAKFLETKGPEKYAGFSIAKLPTWGSTRNEVMFLPEPDPSLLEENDLDEPEKIPFAKVGKEAGTSAFLVIDSSKKDCPVLLCDEGEFLPVAKSFAEFLKKLEKPKPAGKEGKGAKTRTAAEWDRVWRTIDSSNNDKNYEGSLKLIESWEVAKIPPPNAKEKKNLAEAISNLFNSCGIAKGKVPGQDPMPDWERSIAWANAGKITPRWAYLNIIDWYAYSTYEFEKAIARAEELLALEPDEQENQFYGYKAIGLAWLGLGNDAKAEAAYKILLKRCAHDEDGRKKVVKNLDKHAAKLKSKALAKKIAAQFNK